MNLGFTSSRKSGAVVPSMSVRRPTVVKHLYPETSTCKSSNDSLFTKLIFPEVFVVVKQYSEI